MSWNAEYFSQANPAGTGQGDVPALPRRVADSIENLGEVEVQDLVVHTEVTENGTLSASVAQWALHQKNMQPSTTSKQQ